MRARRSGRQCIGIDLDAFCEEVRVLADIVKRCVILRQGCQDERSTGGTGILLEDRPVHRAEIAFRVDVDLVVLRSLAVALCERTGAGVGGDGEMWLGQLVSQRLADGARARHEVNLCEHVAVTLEQPYLSTVQSEDVVRVR